MRRLIIACSILSIFGLSSQAHAIGCLSGAVAGGVAGHYAHHHAILGAAAGCVAGHHLAKERKLAKKRQEEAAKHHVAATPSGSNQ
jgi:hypothetical protein